VIASPRTLLVAVLLAASACARTPPAPDERYTQLYRQLHPSVALLTMQIPGDDPKRKGLWDDAYGTGVVVASGSWGTRLLTAAHVVADARNLRATIGDAGKSFAVRIVARSNDDDDLALLAIDATNLAAVRFATANDLQPGSAIGVLGYPIPDAFTDEQLGTTVSLYTGRVASIRKGAIEVDVPIIPGESGGPVFAVDSGEVIGLAESRFDEEHAIGFATPVDVIRRFLAAHPLPSPGT
jgi:S1-C subfamily serine protease